MRLDHLLSKENKICLFVLSLGWVLVSIPLVAEFLLSRVGFACDGKFLFSGESKCRTCIVVCGVFGIDETG